jgi:hypothetical protein
MFDAIRRQLHTLLETLDQEKVGLYKWVLYIVLILDGLYNALLVTDPTNIAEAGFHGQWYTFFLILWICGPAMTLMGKIASPTKRFGLAGFIMRFTGDIATLGALTAYLTSTVTTSPWGTGNFGGPVILYAWLMVLLFIIRDWRRIDRHEWVKP